MKFTSLTLCIKDTEGFHSPWTAMRHHRELPVLPCLKGYNSQSYVNNRTNVPDRLSILCRALYIEYRKGWRNRKLGARYAAGFFFSVLSHQFNIFKGSTDAGCFISIELMTFYLFLLSFRFQPLDTSSFYSVLTCVTVFSN